MRFKLFEEFNPTYEYWVTDVTELVDEYYENGIEDPVLLKKAVKDMFGELTDNEEKVVDDIIKKTIGL